MGLDTVMNQTRSYVTGILQWRHTDTR